MKNALLPAAVLAALVVLAPRARAQDSFDYRAADSVALATPAANATPQALAVRLTAGLATDREKARALYRWITGNIEYDAGAFFGSRFAIPMQDPASVLRRKRAVCEGFSMLYLTMARAAGLEAVEVVGFAKAYSGNPRNPVTRQQHTWNAVRVDGQWHALDASWGAGDIVGERFVRRVRDFYFFTPPEKLIYSHMAQTPAMQLLPRPLSVAEFDRQAILQRDFWELGFAAADVRRAEQTSRGFVGVFPVPQHPIQVAEAPLEGKLAPGAVHRFRVRAPGATEVFAITGTTWTPLPARGGEFAGEAALTGNDLVLLARYPENPAGAVFMRYESAAAARGRRADR